MSCRAITQGRSALCKEALGGIKKVYFINQGNVDSSKITLSGEGEKLITGFSSAINIYTYEAVGFASSLEESNEVSRENGTSIFTQTLTLVLHSQDASASRNLSNLSKTSPAAIVEDSNGKFMLIGLNNGLDVSVASSTGTALGDMNGYTLTATGIEAESAYFVDETIIGNTTDTVIQA